MKTSGTDVSLLGMPASLKPLFAEAQECFVRIFRCIKPAICHPTPPLAFKDVYVPTGGRLTCLGQGVRRNPHGCKTWHSRGFMVFKHRPAVGESDHVFVHLDAIVWDVGMLVVMLHNILDQPPKLSQGR